MSETEIRIVANGICDSLVRPNVRGVAVIASTYAAPARTVRTLGLTASNQCTSFSACILAHIDCAGGTVGTMGLASNKDAKYLVDHHSHFCNADARLSWDRISQPRIRAANNLGRVNDGRVSLSLSNRSPNDSVADGERYRLAL